MKTLSSFKSFGGTQSVHEMDSAACACAMQFAVYVPQGEGPFPVLYWLSGLTCTPMNFVEKAGAQRLAAEHGVIVIAPDTSPRGDEVPDDDAYDLGQGAGFYLSATQSPWAKNYHMDQWLVEELVPLVDSEFPTDLSRRGIFGHSMGGHGALVSHLKYPQVFHTVSAFAPIVNPSAVPWGQKAFTAYLGDDREQWQQYDACALLAGSASRADILIEQGLADPFLGEQLQPDRFVQAAQSTGRLVELRQHEGYDHSYYFIASYLADHFHWHMARL